MVIESLIKHLNRTFISKTFKSSRANGYYHLLSGMQIKREDIMPYVRGPDNFAKIPLSCNQDYNLYLIRWGAGHSLPRHGHPNTGCIFKLIDGKLEETLYEPNQMTSLTIMNKGEVCYIDDTMGEHTVSNPTDDFSYSLHLYYDNS